MKFARLNSCIQSFAEVDNENLLKVKLSIQHDGANKNGTKFSLDNIRKAESTLRNIPILAYIKRDENGEAQDFDQHNMIQRVVETDEGYDLVTTYLEKPIGVIPTESEITYEEIDGRTYLCATGYIWKRYANEGLDILMQSEQKGTSMEIEIYDGKKDKIDGLYDITDYGFLGVTCLGDDVESGMYDTTITKYSTSKSFKRELEEIYTEIFNLENGKEELMSQEVKETMEVPTEEVVEEIIEDTTVVVEEEIVEDVVVEEEIVEDVVIEEPTIEEPVVEEEVVEEVAEFSVEELVEKLGAKEMEVNSLREKIASYEEELNSLREFKAVKDKEALVVEVDQIASKFTTLDVTEIEAVKTKVLSNEITKAEFERELYYLVGVKALESKAKYTVETTDTPVARVIPIVEKTDEYGGLLKKHNLV